MKAKIKVYSKSELARLYGYSTSTLKRRLTRYHEKIISLGYRSNESLLSAKVVSFLFNESDLGHPEV